MSEAEAAIDDAVTRCYRRFKEWRKRDFTEDDVTWCEVRADLVEIAAELAPRQRDEAVGELIMTVEWARNRLEKIADDSWHGDGRDLKRSLIGVFIDFDQAVSRYATPSDATAALEARDARVWNEAIERVEAARETFRLALPGSDEEFAAGLAGFDMALSALKKPEGDRE